MHLPVVQYEQHFPFDTIRQQQIEAIEFAIENWSKGKKYVVLEMGTGCGKSAIGVTLSRWLRNAYPLSQDAHEDAGAWFLTTQKVLQEQYMRDFGSCSEPMKTIKSSNNYVCQMFDTSNFQMSCAEIHRLMSAHDFFKTMYKMCQCSCRYREEKKEFIESLDSLTNFPYFFAESNYSGQISMRQLLIVDEAHTVEEQLGKFVEVTVSEKFAKDKLKKKMPAHFADLSAAVTWIKGPYKTALKKKVEEVKNLLKDPRAAEKGQVKSLTDYAKKFEILDKHMCKINRFIADFNDANWVMNVVPAQGKSMRKLVFKPVDVSPYAVTHLFGYGKKVLMLSATILDKGVFCRTLGLKEDDVAFLRVPSPFPVENRPIHYLPVGNMSKGRIDSTLPKMVEVVKMLLQQHANEKGIIHCVNYKVAQFLYENIGGRLLIHDSSNRDQVVEYHCTCDEPTVLLSPSMMEGIDLRDDRSRFQMLCKIPFPYLGDEVVKKRMAKNRDWYDYQTVRSVIQALGRSIRNENDHAVSYILDADWERFFKRTKRMFPDEIVKALQ